MKNKHKVTSLTAIASVIITIFSTKGGAAQSEMSNPEQPDANSAAVMEYNPDFIRGGGVDVARFKEGNPVTAGVYNVLVTVNGERRGKYDVHFNELSTADNALAAFTLQELQAIGIKIDETTKPGLKKQAMVIADKRFTIQELIDKSHVYYNQSDFELDITVPQANQIVFPRGYTDPSRWDSGETVGYLDYNANIYSTYNASSHYSDPNNDYTSTVSFLGGLNLLDWRLRKRTNLNWAKNDGGMKTDNLYTYAAKDITAFKSQFLIGDSNTNGEVFDSFNLRGAQLTSDDRMLPEGLRNYSPIVRGVADTNAKVTIMQHGQKIYETVVPRGQFELSDIGAMGYGGDLQMTITEADGRQKFTTIPFSAPPMLLHQGVTRFSIALGELRDDVLRDLPKILQGTVRYGLKNRLTVYGGAQFGEFYQSLAIGNAINTIIGGFSIDMTRARSKLGDEGTKWGNSYKIAYSKYLDQTNTNMTIAAYRYSSEGYYSLRDASIEREGYRHDDYLGSSYRAKQSFSVTVSQALWANISLDISGTYYNYWDDRGTAKQYSITYNQALDNFSYSLSALRNSDEDGNYENTVLVSVNVPFGRSSADRPLFDSLYTSYSNSNKGNEQFSTNLSGSRGPQDEVNYGMGTSFANADSEGSHDAFSGYVNYRSPIGQYGLTGSVDNRESSQVSFSASGSVVAHKGGVTLGPQLGEYPFAIIGAKGAKGATIINGNGAKIDGRGYAIMPSLTPYRENQINVSTKGLPDTVDVLENEKIVVPRMGAAIGVDMKTLVGVPVVLILRDQNNEFLPIGTEIVDDNNVSQSVIGQGGMAFVRGWDPLTQNLYAHINKDKCKISPQQGQPLSTAVASNSITQLEAICVR